MADRQAYAVLQASIGRNQHRQFPVKKIQSFACESNMDVDVDSFSLDIGDPDNQLGYLLSRDTEVRAAIFLADEKGHFQQIFSGIGDQFHKSTDDMTFAMTGRDLSSLAMSDATPGKYKHVRPKQFIEGRAAALGLTNTRIHAMSEIGTLIQNGSETEWAFWYRIVRKKGMWMWTGPNGQLVVDKLAYSVTPSYSFGRPTRGSTVGWIMPETVEITKDTSGRVGEVWVYAQDAKTNTFYSARGIDTTIRAWKRLPRKIITSNDAKSSADAKKQADLEVFESIVGAFEIQVTLHDTGILVKQNTMARINIPELDLVGTFFIVGVRRTGGPDGITQVIRLRQKTFALSRRVPDDPKITETDASTRSVPASLAAYLAAQGGPQGVRWADSFVRAAREFGTANGWDFALFLGVLLAMCEHESGFRNVLQGGSTEWMSWDAWQSAHGSAIGSASRQAYEATFRNDHMDDVGEGPMQLSTQAYKEWADEYGWNGTPKHDEFEGGRWNPDSNIRASARALIQKLQAPPAANPNQSETIWWGVQRYNGTGDKAVAYMNAIKRAYDVTWKGLTEGVVAASEKLPAGTSTSASVPGHGKIAIPPNAPDEVKKAINFCLRHQGDPYQNGGYGPYYDCSSFVTAAYASASAALRDKLDEPHANHHGETTYTLFAPGRFTSVKRDKLLAGDLVFFSHPGGNSPEHVAMYLGEGFIIHDPRPGKTVTIENLASDWFSSNYLGARRLVNWYIPGVSDFGGNN